MDVGASNKWVITVTVMTGTLMSALDLSIVNVALPYMRGNLVSRFSAGETVSTVPAPAGCSTRAIHRKSSRPANHVDEVSPRQAIGAA